MQRIPVADIAGRLNQQIENLCQYLLPHGRRVGPLWEVGSINGEPGKTLKVKLTGEHQGKWIDWNGQENKGDALDLWAQSRGISMPDAIREAKRWLGINEPEIEEKKYARPVDDKPKVNPDGPAMHWLVTERKLKPEIVNRYRVQGDTQRKAIIFPAYSPSETLINRSYRTLEAEKKVWQDKEAAPCLFGWQALTPEDYASREILICEGQIDAMTWAQWGIPALSVPNGSGNKWLDYEWENLQVFKTIYLSFDNDGKTEKSLQEAISRLGKHRVRVVKFRHKDANDALKAGVTAEQAKAWVDSSEYINVPHLVTADHFADGLVDEFFPDPNAPRFYLPFTKHDDVARSFEFRPGELTLWTGVSGHGKSTALNFGVMSLGSRRGKKSLICSFEMLPKKVMRRMILATGVNIETEADARGIAKALGQKILFCDKIGSIRQEDLFDLMEYAYARYGVGDIAVDSLMRIEGLQEDYPAQNAFIIRCVTFARETGVHIHIVAHPRKASGNSSPEAHEIAGSGHLRDNADNVVAVFRNREKEEKRERGENGWQSMPDAKFTVLKDREKGEYLEFPLRYDPERFCYSKFTPNNQ